MAVGGLGRGRHDWSFWGREGSPANGESTRHRMSPTKGSLHCNPHKLLPCGLCGVRVAQDGKRDELIGSAKLLEVGTGLGSSCDEQGSAAWLARAVSVHFAHRCIATADQLPDW